MIGFNYELSADLTSWEYFPNAKPLGFALTATWVPYCLYKQVFNFKGFE